MEQYYIASGQIDTISAPAQCGELKKAMKFNFSLALHL